MTKVVDSKTFRIAVSGDGMRHTRPVDTTPPSNPDWSDLSPPVPFANSAALLWVNGQDGDSGIRDTQVEYSIAGSNNWQVMKDGNGNPLYVPYNLGQGVSATVPGLQSSTAYSFRLANHNFAGALSGYSPIKTLTTLPSTTDLSPGKISLTATSYTVQGGQAISISVTRTGAGVGSPAVNVDWSFSGAVNLPSPANNTLNFPAGADGVQFIQTTAPNVAGNLILNLVSVTAVTGNLQPSVGVTQASVTVIMVSATGKKWNPNHYGGSRNPTFVDDRKIGGQNVEMNLVFAAPNVAGLKIFYYTGIFGSPGSFDFSKIFRDLKKLKAQGKRLMVCIQGTQFGAGSYTDLLPASIYNNSKYAVAPPGFPGKYGFWTSGGNINRAVAYWDPNVNTDFILPLFTALGTTVNPDTGLTLDQDPFVEQISFVETSFQADALAGNTYTTTAMVAQYKRIMDVWATVFPHTLCMLNNNYAGTQANSQSLFDYAYARGIAQGGPDVYAIGQRGAGLYTGLTWGQRAALGSLVGDSNFTGPDLRGKAVMMSDTQGPELSVPGRYTMYTPHSFFTANMQLHQSHIVWTIVAPGTTGDPSPAYPADGINSAPNPGNWDSVLDVINGNPITYVQKPTSISSGTVTLQDGGASKIVGSGFGTNLNVVQGFAGGINGPIEQAANGANATSGVNLGAGWSYPGVGPSLISTARALNGSRSLLNRFGYNTAVGGVFDPASWYQYAIAFDPGAAYKRAVWLRSTYKTGFTLGQVKLDRMTGSTFDGGFSDASLPNILLNCYIDGPGSACQASFTGSGPGDSFGLGINPSWIDDDWVTHRYDFIPGAQNTANGSLAWHMYRGSDATNILKSSSAASKKFWGAGDPAYRYWIIQHFLANGAEVDGAQLNIDQALYGAFNTADTSFPKILLLGEAPTFAACKKLVPQYWTSWADNVILFTANQGQLPSLSSAYAYVLVAINTPLNPNGILVQAA